MSEVLALRAEGICKTFGAVRALDNVNFELKRGEVHALLGENGAGKSTLVKVLGGVYSKDRGSIFVNQSEADIPNPTRAAALGINVIHQDIRLVRGATVGENIFMNHEPTKRGFIDWPRIHREAKAILARLGVDVDTRTQVERLGVAERQMVQIAKALSLHAEILIMDEPTAALSEAESENLFRVVAQLKAEGVSIIYISHRLDEVLRIADRITVLRDGKYVGTIRYDEATLERVIQMMVGREIGDLFPKVPAAIGDVVLEAKNVTRKGLFADVSLQVRRGEILGLAGLLGSGGRELAHVMFGLDRMDSGEIFIQGRKVRIRGPEDAIRAGIGFVPEDRRARGLCQGLSVGENIVMASQNAWSRMGFLRRRGISRLVSDSVRMLSIKTAGAGAAVTSLSGGNQQKVVVAKWLATKPRVLILDEPTLGIDIGAKTEIHSIMNDLAQQGVGILMISSEMPEVLGMSDRVVCMYKGKITGEFQKNEATEGKVRAACSGLAI